MASDVVRDLADNIMGTNNTPEIANLLTPSREASNRTQEPQPQSQLEPSLSYVWATEDSMFSCNVDRWIGGDTGSPIHAGVQPSRLGTSQRSTLAASPSVDSTGFWYVAAMVLPLFSLSGCRNWRCTPSTVLNTMELLLTQVSGYCSRARNRLRRLTREQGARDIFAGAMDIILVVYAIGFLLLSMYQASVFQQF